MKNIKRAGLALFISIVSFTSSHVSVVSFEQLKQEAALKHNDTLYVVNFWATWCDPCVKELPYFQNAYKKFNTRKVKMIYVSLNSLKDLPKVEKFADDNDLKPKVLLLNASDPNVWINGIDSSWSGALPATALYRSGKKLYFHEGDFTQDKLNDLIQSKIK